MLGNNIPRPGMLSSSQLPDISREETPDALVVGTSQLFDPDDRTRRRFVPMPSADPRDPLNLPQWRKWTAVAALCFFGALALSSEWVVGILLPVFVLEYAGIDPRILGSISLPHPGGAVDLNPLASLASLGGPPLYQTALLSTLPIMANGIASFLLVPLSIAVGRRPVLLLTGIAALIGGFWAGSSTSLSSHLAARCLQGLGAGAVEALIPLMVQDFMFVSTSNLFPSPSLHLNQNQVHP